mgnify:CR=1 FL=1
MLAMIAITSWYKMEMEEIARWAYIAFVVIAIVAGLAVGYMAWDGQDISGTEGYITLIMLILGIIIGITSITAKEVTPFLIASIALIVVGTGIGTEVGGGVWGPLYAIEELRLLYYWATEILKFIVAFAAPAAVIISIKSVLAITKD